MDEITGALIGIALVLAAVFLPMAFFGGSTGVIYRQFSITIVSAMVLSVMVALVLTPGAVRHAAEARTPGTSTRQHGRFFGWFNRNFDATRTTALRDALGRVLALDRPACTADRMRVIVAVLVLLFVRLPTASCRKRIRAIILTQFTLPVGATQDAHAGGRASRSRITSA